MRYTDLTVRYSERDGVVDVIAATGSEYETKRGIKVGDGISKVYKRYRKSEITAEGKYGNVDAYYIDFELSLGRKGWKYPSMRLIIRHDGEKIIRISIQYDEVFAVTEVLTKDRALYRITYITRLPLNRFKRFTACLKHD